jgi:NAD(P)-dependent dehydrogenase (short-subunit alcohol dehydrogenase family)
VALLAASGSPVAAIARRSTSLDALTALGRRRGWTIVGVTADLGKAADAERGVQEATRQIGAIDTLVVSAGHWVEGKALLHELDEPAWTTGLADNLDPVFYACRAVLPGMVERRRGSVVLVTAAERIRHAGTASYCAAKGAVVDLTGKLAHDYRPFGIRVNAVLAGTMEHELDIEHPPDPAEPLALRDKSGAGAWEVARTIRHLAGQEGRWISGALVTVDGGHSTRGREPGVTG